MSLLLPDAQQFVIIGSKLKNELEQYQTFKRYFQNNLDSLLCIANIDDLNLESIQDKSRTLFIIKHFDYDPNQSHRELRSDGDSLSIMTNGYNNNHIINPLLARLAEEESEVESTGYTTDYDDIEEESAEQQNLQGKQQVLFDDKYEQFDGGRCFNYLMSQKCSIMGSTAFLQIIKSLSSPDDRISMVPQERPLHNLAMKSTLITFSGIASKAEAQKLLTLTRYMGAKSREDVTNKTTHLVAGNLRGLKYRRALELGLFVMSTSWVRESFRLAQNDLEFDATLPEIVQHYKLKPFHGLHMAFVGFKEEEMRELGELTVANEAVVVEADSLSCTHIVLDAISGSEESNMHLVSSLNLMTNPHVVYREWFWASLEMEGKASEDAYAVPGFRPQTRRISKSRRSSTGHYNSFSNVLSPMLDYSRSPESITCLSDRQLSRSRSVSIPEKTEPDLSNITPRHRACLELLQTERNYVKILEVIVSLFKVPLENPDNPQDPILPMTDVKIIFGNLTPIYEVHKRMLSNLENLIENDWKETNCIGKIFVTHSIDLLKAYPPFVNFFEDTKKTIITCDIKYPRFHAFLKRCQSKIECNRESLTEMLIRPVQRLPSISLIISELIKRTDDENMDKKYLVEALESIRRVMNLINEDKRKTEGQIAMFDIVNNIEDCPPNLLSALRRFICKVEARLLFMNNESEVISSKSHKIVLFLFSDLIEICKIRSLKRSHSSKSSRTYVPIRRTMNTGQAGKISNKKEHRHLDELRLCDVMNIYKKCQSPEMNDAIVIQARPSQRYDQNYRYYPFVIDDESMSKDAFVDRLEECLLSCDDPDEVSDYVPNQLPPISNDEIDFGFSNLLVNSMEKSRLSRVLSIRQALLSPSIKNPRYHALYN